ncbi:hypothetical protein L198_04225 [Cryptococcus wingfieldii CBS 7118]|uniref:Uncharacterized protein n=1 Tax=Cryptococcus wingfieldii CBS 7118 TaxID=1295528 RepID=A0A1E3J999_9TREE|nr:hypothetical protein L198_04225 [Cryptococcus wingfieldii CBS 7118]ODN96511.1 hypothetical protein L198_04225 [Cryptococcus wingfieldii CBS 7118]
MDDNRQPHPPLQRPSSSHSSRPVGAAQDPPEAQMANASRRRQCANPCSSPPMAPNPLPDWSTSEDVASETNFYAKRPERDDSLWKPNWQGASSTPMEPSVSNEGSVGLNIRTPIASPKEQYSFARPSPAASPEEKCPNPHSSLLTSTPLNRTCLSANHSPCTSPTPPPAQMASSGVKKRTRSNSLPCPNPPKRPKTIAYPPPTRPPSPRSLRHPMRPQHPFRGAPAREAMFHCVVAGRSPAINTKSLKTLDAVEILKNKQLRHDLLFDTLAFRPVNAGPQGEGKVGRYAGVVSTSAVPVVDPSTSNVVTELYWQSVDAELKWGCRCTRWSLPEGTSSLKGDALRNLVRVHKCLCGQWRPELSERQWWAKTKAWPSRLPELIKTLREILMSLMGSTTPCADHFAHSFSREALEAHEQTCPTVTHSLVPHLQSALDPEFLTMQVRRGSFNIELFKVLGNAMRVHCAPVRDGLIDRMVETAMAGKITEGLKMCFDCAEVMKLDIANHQVHSLRPYLWQNAGAHEYAAFEETLLASRSTFATSKTRRWINQASLRMLKAASPAERTHLIGKCACGNANELAARSVLDGFLELVFEQKCGEGRWPPLTARTTSTEAPLWEDGSGNMASLPEVLQMDGRRIRDFHASVVELAATHLVLMAIRELYRAHTQSPNKEISSDTYNFFLSDILESFDRVSATTPGPVGQDERDAIYDELSFALALRVVLPDEMKRISEAEELKDMLTPDKLAHIHPVKDQLYMFLRNNISRESQRLQDHMPVMRKVLYKVLTDVFMSYRFNPKSLFFDVAADKCKSTDKVAASSTGQDHQSKTGSPPPMWIFSSDLRFKANRASRAVTARHDECLETCKEEELLLIANLGLEGVVGPIKDITERMVRLLGFNLSVFKEVYLRKGFMAGSGKCDPVNERGL